MAKDRDGATLQVVDAQPEDARFLAWVLQTAALSHVERSTFDLFVNGDDVERQRFLELLALTPVPQWCNYRHFIIARSGDEAIGALCGYFVEDCDGPLFARTTIEAVVAMGWDHDRLVAGWNRIKTVSRVALDREPGAWIVESVAVVPAYRRRGVVTRLMDAILDRGRQRGATTAEISVAIGNDAAQQAYEKAGFAVVAEARDREYEATFGCPGMRLLRRRL